MNFSEFKKLLGAEPHSKDADFVRAQSSSPEHKKATEEAMAFEDSLRKALEIPVPEDLVDGIQAAVAVADHQKTAPWWYRAAAAAVLSVGVAASVWWQSSRDWQSIDEYLADHWEYDGKSFVSEADGAPAENARAIFASIGMRVSDEYAAQIDHIGNCRTPGSRGAHYVVTTENGPVTIIYMPSVAGVAERTMTVDGLLAQVLPMETGSLLVIGPDMETITPWFAMTREALKPISQTA